ncbi:MAG: GNAT family N-acetyltransferase [Acidimicrobiales bacterium]|nr:GNAT family N-acetyltransferase [Acidimicrobiales bacterium]
MRMPREERRVGLEYLDAVTTLCQRARIAHPTKGLFEAADFQWWWRKERPTDNLEHLFWFDEAGRPEAAVIATDWGDGIALDPILMPDATEDVAARVIDRGLAHAADCGFARVEQEVDADDRVLMEVLTDRGFAVEKDGLVETWIVSGDRPKISLLADGYRLRSRAETKTGPHHMVPRSGSDEEKRLRQTSLYRPDLDLVVLDSEGATAGYGLFWFDPTTATGLVEPMRTEEDHQQRGLARHILTAGLDRLAEAGAERIKICYEPDNQAAKHLYLSTGFEPVKQTVILSGSTRS